MGDYGEFAAFHSNITNLNTLQFPNGVKLRGILWFNRLNIKRIGGDSNGLGPTKSDIKNDFCIPNFMFNKGEKQNYGKEVKNTLIVSLVAMIFLTTLAVSVSAITGCTSGIYPFVRTYSSNIGCDYVDAPIEMNSKSASTRISASTGVALESYVAAWESNGALIDSQVHNGNQGTSSAVIIWIIAEPVKSLHQAEADTVPGCNGHHGRVYQ